MGKTSYSDIFNIKQNPYVFLLGELFMVMRLLVYTLEIYAVFSLFSLRVSAAFLAPLTRLSYALLES